MIQVHNGSKWKAILIFHRNYQLSSLPERKRLRSSNKMDIARVRANTILGNRRFEVAAPILEQFTKSPQINNLHNNFFQVLKNPSYD